MPNASLSCWGVQVTQVKTFDKHGYTALQLGCGSKRDHQVNGTQIGHFNAAGVPIKRKVVEFRVSKVRPSPAVYAAEAQWRGICSCTMHKTAWSLWFCTCSGDTLPANGSAEL